MRLIFFSILFCLQTIYPQLIQNGINSTPHNFNTNEKSNDLSLCRTCHLSEGTKVDSIQLFNSDDLCLNCHNGIQAKFFPVSSNINSSLIHLDNFSHHYNIGQDDEIHCVECHNPHDNTNGNFLRQTSDNVCVSCHDKLDFETSVHKTPFDPALSNNRNMECESCHNIHLISNHESLTIKPENQLCMDCHDGIQHSPNEIPSKVNMNNVINKFYTHITLNESNDYTSIESVVCSDCHNPHLVVENEMGLLDGALNGSDGVSPWGMPIEQVQHEYEICYKCHAYTNLNSTNIADKFKPSNASFHPVENLSYNTNATKSLKSGWSNASLMDCSDCHGNDNQFGVQGPHGSNNKGLLKSHFEDSPFTVTSTQTDNALCFECHKEFSITQSEGFRWHKLHIDSGYNCSACHDSHGSQNYPSLLDFDTHYIKSNPNGQFDFTKLTPTTGSCTMTCHGHVHDGTQF